MYRDEREALLQRADALERELTEKKIQVSEQDEELEVANQRMAAQQRELEHLRKRLAKLEPRKPGEPQAKTRMLVLLGATAALAVAGAAMFFVAAPAKPPTPRAEPPIATPAPPPEPNTHRAAIRAGMAQIRDRVRACSTLRGDTDGMVTTTVRVNPDGSVRDVTATPASPLATCVRDAVEKAHFQATNDGFVFRYPFAFR